MLSRMSLRGRLILAMVILITVCSSIFAVGMILIKERLEEVTFGDMVEEQLQVILTQTSKGVPFDNEVFQAWEYYAEADLMQLPAGLRGLAPGTHHSIVIGDGYYEVAVSEVNGKPVYLTYDITEWEQQEHEVLYMVAWGVGVMFVIAILLGMYAARTVLAPLRQLTRQVSSLQPDERNIRIAEAYQGNEVSRIARAFDHYQERMDQFVEREKFFTAAASHELRTPLSIVMGAVDVLDIQKGQAPAQQRALGRIKRACGEMLGFIEASLLLSREEAGTQPGDQGVDLAQVVKAVVEGQQAQIVEHEVSLETKLQDDIFIEQPESIVRIVIGNIFRNALDHTRKGYVHIEQEGKRLLIKDTGSGIPSDQLSQVFDRNYTTRAGGTGLGLNLVKRICDRYGWSVRISSERGQGTVVELDFSGSDH